MPHKIDGAGRTDYEIPEPHTSMWTIYTCIYFFPYYSTLLQALVVFSVLNVGTVIHNKLTLPRRRHRPWRAD